MRFAMAGMAVLAAVVLVVAGVGCSASDDGPGATDTLGTEIGDSSGETSPGDGWVADEAGAQADGTEIGPEEGPDTPTETACECPAKACHAPGVCDPQTGTCDYAQLANQAVCDAKGGVPGSGLCLDGDCIGFGACDHRTYGQAAGTACNFDGECASGRCVSYGDGWTTYCTQACGAAAPCPAGMACVTKAGGRECRPLDRNHVLPGDASGVAFQVCNRPEDCASGLCLSTDGKKFCSPDCGKNGAASDAMCGNCGHCRDNGTALGFAFPFYCVPNGSLDQGKPCGMAGDCLLGFCQDGYCSGQCIEAAGISSCGASQACVAGVLASDPTTKVCVGATAVNQGLGGVCEGDWSCAAGTCLDFGTVKRCSVDCSSTPCVDGTCVDATAGGKRCLPADQVGVVAYGGACDASYLCATGLGCLAGTCVQGCQQASDCPGRTCFGDVMLQAGYCAGTCADATGCPAGMACWNGACVVTRRGGTWLFGTCRADADCETGSCRKGQCTESCSAQLPCEGATAVTAQPLGICQPCDPAKYGADCNPADGFALNECIAGADGSAFCVTPCLGNPLGCPVGTRCYAINGYEQECAPVTGSCQVTVGCAKDGTCRQPQAPGTPCGDDAECRGGKCVDGRCQGTACVADGNCGCGNLSCVDGACVRNPEAAAPEAEPNDTVVQAQAVDGGQTIFAATLYPAGDGPDVDLYRVTMQAGQALDVRTGPFCKTGADTLVRLLTADGTPIAGWENDDIDSQGGNYFSFLMGYVAATDGDVLVEVTQSPLVAGVERAPYLLTIRTYTPLENDTCAGATSLDGADGYAGDLADGMHQYAAPSCTGWASTGRDAAFSLTVPAGKDLRVYLTSSFDGQVFVVSDCAQADATCLAGADRVYSAGKESALWVNDTGAAKPVFVLVSDVQLDGPTTYNLGISLDDVAVPANDTEPGAFTVFGTGVLTGTTVGATDDFATCGTTALPGRDAYWVATVKPGTFWTFTVAGWTGAQPTLALYVGAGGAAGCTRSGTGTVSIAGPTDAGAEPLTVYLVADSATAGGAAWFTVDVVEGPASACFGPCDGTTFAAVCRDTTDTSATLCTCDATSSVIQPVDCDAECKKGGALSGICHAFTTPGHEGDSCLCTWDCASVADQCAGGAWTNCTCAAADPCKWQGDGACDDFCALEYPAAHFDDTADCAL